MAQQRVQIKSVAAKKKMFASATLLAMSTLLFFYISYQPKSPVPFPDHSRRPTQKERHLQGRNFTFIVKVLTYDRLDSVSRCLQSLALADYENDRVKLHIFVDHFKREDSIGKVGSAEIVEKLNRTHQILDFVDGFEWNHGEKQIHYRTRNVGLQAQWLEAWWPSSENEFAFVVEDDLVLSPLFYRYLKALIHTYYFGTQNSDPSVYGISLQRPRFVGAKHGHKLKVDNNTRLFLYQMVGTWGQLLFPKPWKEFRMWYDIHKTKGIEPILEGMVTTGWYRRMKQKIWTPWFIKFIHARGYFNIYTNFLQERALSASYRDAGVNYGKNIGPDSQLINSSTDLDINLWEMKPLNSLSWYDFCFQKVFPFRFIERLDILESILSSFDKQKKLTLVNLFGASEDIVRNLLCQLQRLGLKNLILIGDKTSLLEDLSRRGYVVVGTQLLDHLIKLGLVDHHVSSHKGMEQAFISAYIMKNSVQLGYSICFMSANAFPVKSVCENLEVAGTDIVAMQTMSHLRTEFLYVASTAETIKLWNKVHTLFLSKEILVIDNHSSGDDTLGTYVKLAMKGLNLILKSPDGNFMREVGDSTETVINAKSIEKSTSIIFWSSLKDKDSLNELLKSLNLWRIDDDLSCTEVVCH